MTFTNKILLITGGTGSFGNAVLRRFLETDIAEIRIFSRDEKKQDDMRKKYQSSKLKFYIGDVRDYTSILSASRGSVIPLFVDQIRADKPLTITDPNMTRFMMTLDDAVDLVLYAFEHGQNGDIFVQKAPAATINVLAEALTELLGKPNYPINIIGTRHGEKAYEALLSREEMANALDQGYYYRIPADQRDLNYDKYFVDGDVEIVEYDDYNSHNTDRLDVERMKKLLLKLEFIQALTQGQYVQPDA